MRSYVLVLILITISLATPLHGIYVYTKTRSITLYAPAVSEQGRGVLTKITLTVASPGSGRVFFSAQPLTELDTQAAARIAAMVAASIAGVSYYSYDYFVVMESETMIVGGPSAGALMTVGFLALLLNATIRSDVTMTGMINPDGTIGPVGGLKEKLEAAAKKGFKTFLIPYGQRIVRVKNVTVEQYPWGIVQHVEYYNLDLIEYGKELGVNVIEVASVRDAFKYFTGIDIMPKTGKTVEVPSSFVDELSRQTRVFLNETNRIISEVEEELSGTPKVTRDLAYIIKNIIERSKKLMETSKDMLKNHMYVVAVNNAFRSYYLAMYAYWLTNHDRVEELTNTTKDLIVRVSRKLDRMINEVMKTPSPLTSYEILIAAKIRLVDAQESLKSGIEDLRKGYSFDALRSLVYAYCRALTVDYWSDLYDKIRWGPLISYGDFYRTALLFYGISDNIVSYAYTLSKDLGVETATLRKALSYMDKAREAASENDTITMIGEALYAASYAVISIHEMFSVSVVDVLRKLTSKIANETHHEILLFIEHTNETPLLPIYYYLYGMESMEVGGENLMDILSSLITSLLYIKFNLLMIEFRELAKTTPSVTTITPTTTLPKTTPIPQQSQILPETKTSKSPAPNKGVSNLGIMIPVIACIIGFAVGYILGLRRRSGVEKATS